MILTALFFMCFCTVSSSQEVLRIAKISDTPDHYIGGKILEAAYKRLSIDIEFVVMPAKRCLRESSVGNVDGEIQRIYEIGDSYPTLIRVPISFNHLNVVAFSKNYQIPINGWNSLQGYRVGRIRGIKFMEMGFRQLDPSKIQVVNRSHQLALLLKSDRIDFIVEEKINGLIQFKRLNINGIHTLSPPLLRIKLYHYLNQKHKDLVPRIDDVFKKMAESGELKRLRKTFINELFNASSDELKVLIP